MSTLGLGPLAVSLAGGAYQSVGGPNGFAAPPPPTPGCGSHQYNDKASTSASVSSPFGGGSVGSSSSNAGYDTQCAPTNESTQTHLDKVSNTTTVDDSTTIMTNSSLQVLSECTNQMIVNSITSTTNNSSQNVHITQNLEISVDNVAGNVLIQGTNQELNIDMTNYAAVTLSAFDNIRTDLSNSILGAFNNSVNQETLDKLMANTNSETQATLQSGFNGRVTAEASQAQTSGLPVAPPPLLPLPNLNANTSATQFSSSDISNTTTLSAPYSATTNFNDVLSTSINNAVTQNFTKETLNILAQTVVGSQSLKIKVSNIGGNVSILDTTQRANIVLRQTLTEQLNIGTSIINSVVNSMGIQTDNSLIQKKTLDAGVITANSLRNSSSTQQEGSSSTDYLQTLTQDFGGSMGSLNSCGSSGSSFFSLCCCIILCVCIALSGVGGVMISANGDEGDGSNTTSTESEDQSKAPTSAPETSSVPRELEENPGAVQAGGFFFFF